MILPTKWHVWLYWLTYSQKEKRKFYKKIYYIIFCVNKNSIHKLHPCYKDENRVIICDYSITGNYTVTVFIEEI